MIMDGDKLGEMLMNQRGNCPKCGRTMSFEEGVQFARHNGRQDQVVMCKGCNSVYRVSNSPRGLVFLADVSIVDLIAQPPSVRERQAQPATRTCSKCGKQVNSGELICPHCGKVSWGSIAGYALVILFLILCMVAVPGMFMNGSFIGWILGIVVELFLGLMLFGAGFLIWGTFRKKAKPEVQAAQSTPAEVKPALLREQPEAAGERKFGLLFDLDELKSSSYGVDAYTILFKAVDTSLLAGCTLSDGDTGTTLTGSANLYCIAIACSEPAQAERIKNALRDAAEQGRLPSSLRFASEAEVNRKPLVPAAWVTAAGNLIENRSGGAAEAWKKTRGASK